jgi:hypothetical protein
MKMAERLTEHTRHLPALVVGDQVRVQNQTGPHPTKWDKTGIIIEVRQFDQYVVRVDGSGRVTLRHRKFLRKYIPVIPCHHHSSLGTESYLAYRPLSPTRPISPISPVTPSNPRNMEPVTPRPDVARRTMLPMSTSLTPSTERSAAHRTTHLHRRNI